MSVKKFFRITPEEHRLIAFNAAAAGLEESSYLRIQALGKSQVRHSRRIRADCDELRRCMGAINRAGNVVNQLVALLHRIADRAGMAGLASMADKASAALTELIEAARAIVAALREI